MGKKKVAPDAKTAPLTNGLYEWHWLERRLRSMGEDSKSDFPKLAQVCLECLFGSVLSSSDRVKYQVTEVLSQLIEVVDKVARHNGTERKALAVLKDRLIVALGEYVSAKRF